MAARGRVPEAFVWWLWQERKAGSHLRLIDGRELTVIYPGRRWGSWGPDFREGLVAIDGVVLQGDIEVHVKAGDWQAHGHARDPEYSGTALHVLFDRPTFTQSLNPALPTVSLSAHLLGAWEQLLEEWRQGPAIPPRQICQSPEEAADLLDRAGLARLEGKAARFEGDLTSMDAEDALLLGAVECLGYSQNVEPIRELARRVPPGRSRQIEAVDGPEAAGAMLFGQAGLLPSQRARSAPDDYVEALEGWWMRWSHTAGTGIDWKWRGARFTNTPVRRVAALHSLVVDERNQLGPSVLQVLGEMPVERAIGALRSVAERTGSEYWQGHADFGRALKKPAALIGASRASDIVINAMLPWALAVARRLDDLSLETDVRAVYRSHPPLASNQITRHMAFQVVGTETRDVVNSACRQQGLLHLYRGWCECRDCATCPAARPS